MGDALKRRIKQQRFESPLQEAMLNLLVAAAHVRERTDRVLEESGITQAQYNLLRILRGAHPGGYPRCDIAERMIDRAPDVTRLIDRLERQGLVERDRSDKDRRLSISRITPAGLELIDRVNPALAEAHAYLADRISAKDRLELSRICEGIYDDRL
jgi:DNA-binding MarR family transcriptional regulator